jgi:hypothetical protein
MQPILSEDKEVALELMNNTETSKEMSITNLIKAAVTNKISVKEIANIPESMPILLIAGEKDRIQKTDTLEVMLPKMGSKQTSLVVFPDKGHMLLERKKIDTEVGEVIDKWLDSQQEQFELKIASRNCTPSASGVTKGEETASSTSALLANPSSAASSTASSTIESSLPDSSPVEMPADAFSRNEDAVSSN